MTTSVYSDFFTCLHDETQPVGGLGRGTHHSVFRCAEWYNVTLQRLDQAQIHDFAVIWDEDHDDRIIEVVERMYLAGVLAPVQFIGERKGGLTVVVAARFFWSDAMERFSTAVTDIAESLDDPWSVDIGMFDRSPVHMQQGWAQTDAKRLIDDDRHRVNLYLMNIDSLWKLGTYAPAERPVLESEWDPDAPRGRWYVKTADRRTKR